MAPAKRKAVEDRQASAASPKKRTKRSVAASASSTKPSRTSNTASSAPRSTRSSLNGNSSTAKDKATASRTSSRRKNSVKNTPDKKTPPKTQSTKAGKKSATPTPDEKETTTTATESKISVDVPQSKKPVRSTKAEHDRELEEHGDGPSYWLMKAEPETRIEKGKDVKFSIDDLEAATEPEGWDGVRNAVARNNMRLMLKGDLAFFYHSNCKVPGIVGTMEIAREHSIDETAFDPEHPYYDEKSDRDKPKWCLVHVEFRQKFPEIIKLKELQRYAKDGGILEHMQVLKQSRLSVSKVTKKEWDFIMSLVDMDDIAAASAQHQPKMVE